MTGIAGDEDASSYGEVLGADFLIVGSVLEAGGMVQVNVRVVETKTSRVILSESISIDRNVFVDKAQRFVKVTHSISAGYMYQFIDDFRIHNAFIMYSYNFFYGLALNFQMFYGVSDTVEQKNVYPEGGFTVIDTFEKSFQQMGLNVLFSKHIPLFWGFGITPYGGPSMLNYMDKTVLIASTNDGLNRLYEPAEIRPTFMLFGVRAGLNLEYQISMSYKLLLGMEYQYFPDFKVKKNISYQDLMEDAQFLFWEDVLKLSGYSITAGAAYSF